MHSAYIVVTAIAVVANGFSGLAGFLNRSLVVHAMRKVGVPESWVIFPIATLKLAGALGLLVGLIGVPLVGLAAAIGLVLFWVCAVHTHLLVRDYSLPLGLAGSFLALAVGTLAVGLAA
jgi:hypothetical protein